MGNISPHGPDLPADNPVTASGAELRAATPVAGRITGSLPALKYREFRLFWFGQMISLTGTWVQSVAQQWLVLKLTGSAFKLGLVTTVQFIPLLLLSLVGGVIADRVSKRNLLIATQVISALLAIGLGTLVRTGQVQYWHVIVFAAALGTVNAFYAPARQSFVPELVDRDTMLNAVALNSAIFNGARVVGPAIGGLLVATLGLALNFYLNAASYVAVIVSLLMIRPRPPKAEAKAQNMWNNLAEGLAYIKRTPVVFTLLALVGVASLFAINFTILLPLFAEYVLHIGASGFGFLMASMGVGALCGSVFLAFLTRPSFARTLVFVGAATLTIAEIAFGFSRITTLSIALLVVIGLSQTLFTTTANTSILTLTPPRLQGRVMSVYSLMFLGMTPFGSFLAGWIAQRYGAPTAMIAGGVITLIFTIVVFLFRRRASPPPAGE
ncbi:MAG TPA: MFS transporter [Chloroflexota bacterium]